MVFRAPVWGCGQEGGRGLTKVLSALGQMGLWSTLSKG